MAWNDGLLGVHLEIAADPSPVLHVLAGPGTGKTYAMMRRIARLLESGTPPDRILAVLRTDTILATVEWSWYAEHPYRVHL